MSPLDHIVGAAFVLIGGTAAVALLGCACVFYVLQWAGRKP